MHTLNAAELAELNPVVIGSVKLTNFISEPVYYLWEYSHTNMERVYCWHKKASSLTYDDFRSWNYMETKEEAMKCAERPRSVWTEGDPR
jgi:hypothetical protein